MSSALTRALAIANGLSADEREQLKRLLSPEPIGSASKDAHDAEKWAEFWRIGDELARQIKPDESPTKILNEMRR